MRPSSIAIVGVGRLGSHIAQELIRSETFSTIYLDNRSQDRLESMTLSLRVFASCVGSGTRIIPVGEKFPQEADIVLITLKEHYDPRILLKRELLPEGFDRNVRTIGIKKDLPLVRGVCGKLQGYRGKLIVITNPVDIFTVLVKEWVPTADVYGFGVSVDSARLAFSAQERGIKCSSQDCPLGGVHIGRIVQLRSLWNSRSPLFLQNEFAIDDLLKDARCIGPDIVRGLGFTLHDCAAVFTRDLKWFAGKDPNRKYLCASVGDAHSAAAWPILYSEAQGLYEIFRMLDKSEFAQLERASNLIGDALHALKRSPFFNHNPW
jgi:malate/lactate dehydrogenase